MRGAGVGRGIGARRRSGGVPGGGRGGQPFDLVQQSLLTDGTAVDVEAGDAEHEVAHGLGWFRRGRRRLRQEHPALSERRAPSAIGEQAEMADADEAVGNHMEQEAAEKFVDRELHDLHTVAVGVVAPAQADATVADGEQAVVGERNAVGVAAELGQHVLGPGEGGLAVHDPGLGA